MNKLLAYAESQFKHFNHFYHILSKSVNTGNS